MKIKYLLLVIITGLCFAGTGHSGVGDWTTFTSHNDVRDLLLIHDSIWFATHGGVFNYQISTGSYKLFNNTNGLASIDAQTMAQDQYGRIWVGYGDGWIDCYDPATEQWNHVRDYQGHFIHDLEPVGDTLLVALELGISLYDLRKKEVKETYKHLGWQLNSEIDVLDITVVGREIWAATGSGIARSHFDLANLMAPESWTNYTTANGLPSNQVNCIAVHGDSVYAGTAAGVGVLQGSHWANISAFLDYPDVAKLVSKNGVLYAVTERYITRWSEAEYRWRNVAPELPVLTCLAVTDSSDLWVGRQKAGPSRGFAFFSAREKKWQPFIPPGPPSNEFSGLAVDQDGILWCASPHDGIFKYDGQTWQQFTTADGLVNNGIKCVTVDARNRKWFGSVGGGLILMDTDETIRVFYNDILSGSPSSPDFVVVNDVKADRYDNIWALNSLAANNNAVAVYTPQQDWYFFAVQDGLLSDVVTSLDFDSADRVWVGTQEGVSVIDYNNTLAVKSDDIIAGNNLTPADGLVNKSITDLAIDQDDIVWIATEGGLNYWDQGRVAEQYGLLSNTINVIEVDVRNNKWFGTAAGVSILAADGYSWTHYSTDNSPLVNDNVTSFGFDLETGKVYIGTSRGLSVLETPYSRPRENLSQLKTGPNPFIVGNGQNFAISELSDDVAIKILTPNGELVRHISKDQIFGAFTSWDGKDDNGEYVASGIYILVIYNEETGMHRTGKIAVIRR